MAIDNEAITGREIVYRGPLHYDLLARAFINSGNKRIKNMGSFLRSWRFANDGGAAAYSTPVTMIGFPVPFVSRQQVLELGLTAEGGHTMPGNIQLNYERVKTLK